MRLLPPIAVVACACVLPWSARAQIVPALPDSASTTARGASSVQLKRLSLEDLMQLEVSTVSRKTEPWWTAAGAIDVITNEEIERSGGLNLPDALRLATGVHVGQPSAQNWAVGIRGFNVLSGNKVNVQLDGRNLFTPFFSGVSWDVQDTLLEDISRIEVVRGPAGALWGNYAMNGFIQIETKPAWDTQGLLVTGASGTELPGAFALRYGGTAGPDTFYRAFVKYTQTDWTYDANGHRAGPPTDVVRGGFRTDTRTADDSVLTLEGDVYSNRGTPMDRPDQERFSGESLLAHWRRELALDSELQFTASLDDAWHLYGGNFLERRHALSAGAKYRVAVDRQDMQWGFDGLLSWDHIQSGSAISIDPPSRTYYTTSMYAEDAVTLVPRRWVLTAAGQVQWSAFSGLEVQPTVRIAWTPDPATTVWAAVSRAVRTPVRLDADLVSRFNGVLYFEGNDNLKPETVLAVELGVRHRFGERIAVDLATFLNRYDDIRTYESSTPTYKALPWTFKNGMDARGVGAELTVLYQPFARLSFKGSYRYLDLHLTKDAGSGDFLNGLYEANDPRQVLAVTARADVARNWTFDATVRGTSRLPQPQMNGYLTLDARIGWSPNAAWVVELIGQNLCDPQHPEFITPNSLNQEVARSLTLKATWRY